MFHGFDFDATMLRIAAMNLSVDDVVNAIRQQNVQASLGAVGGVPGDGSAQMVYTLQAKGRLNNVDDFADSVGRLRFHGSLVPVARRRIAHATPTLL